VKMFNIGKTRMIGLRYGEKNYDDMLSRFHLVPERNRQTDGRTDRQTDRQICYINIAHQHTALLTRDKNRHFPPVSRFISEMIQDIEPLLLWKANRKLTKISNGTIFNDL